MSNSRFLEGPPPVPDSLDEFDDDFANAVGELDKLNARPVHHELLIDVADAAVRDAALDDNGAVAEREPEIVEGIELERKRRLDLRAAPADFFDRDRLEHHHLAVKLAEDLNPLGIAFLSLRVRQRPR